MLESFFLFFYAIFKAFLPLPSLEVVLLPLYLANPSLLWWYVFLGSAGTYVGGSIGYLLVLLIKEEKWISFFGEKEWEKGKKLVQKYGVIAVFIGGITPIPDFLLAYVAGFVRMPYFSFVFSDAIARFIRSAIVLLLFQKLGILIDLDQYGLYFLYAFFLYSVTKTIKGLAKKR